MKILIVEDSHMMGKAAEALLTANGHQVTWVVGARSLEPFVGIAPTGGDASLDLTGFDLAFCDGQIEGEFDGPSVVAPISKASVVCVGISTMPDLNEKMRNQGACAGFNKALWFLGLVAGILDPQAIVADPQACQALQPRLEESAKDKAVRGKADQLIAQYIGE